MLVITNVLRCYRVLNSQGPVDVDFMIYVKVKKSEMLQNLKIAPFFFFTCKRRRISGCFFTPHTNISSVKITAESPSAFWELYPSLVLNFRMYHTFK